MGGYCLSLPATLSAQDPAGVCKHHLLTSLTSLMLCGRSKMEMIFDIRGARVNPDVRNWKQKWVPTQTNLSSLDYVKMNAMNRYTYTHICISPHSKKITYVHIYKCILLEDAKERSRERGIFLWKFNSKNPLNKDIKI